jgi:hypothetical protein
MAAMFSGIAFISYLVIKTLYPFNNTTNLNSTELAGYLDATADEIDDEALYSEMLANTSKLENTNTNDTISFLINADVSEDDILNEAL